MTRKAYEDQLVSRFAHNTEAAVEYAYKGIDRLINKARGLLTFNAILFAGFRGLKPEIVEPSIWLTVGALAALIACLPLLAMMFVSWGKGGNHASAEADLRFACWISYWRSHLLTISIFISAIATVIAVVEVWNARVEMEQWDAFRWAALLNGQFAGRTRRVTPLELVLALALLALVVVSGLLVKFFLPGYVTQKGQNLATKEDIAEITRRVEEVRAAIASESALLERRRDVYTRIADALRIFIEKQGNEDLRLKQEEFHSAYSACWLWASDSAITALNEFIDLQRDFAANPDTRTQEELKAAYEKAVSEMRRDAGFRESKLGDSSYRFVRFGDGPPN